MHVVEHDMVTTTTVISVGTGINSVGLNVVLIPGKGKQSHGNTAVTSFKVTGNTTRRWELIC